MRTLIFNRCFNLTRKVYSEMSNHLTFLLLRSDCGGSITFPTAWIVGKERPQSRLYLDRGYKMCFAQANLRTNVKNLLAWSALNRWPSSSKAPTSLSFALQSPPTFFVFFFACGRSSLKYWIEWSAIPFSKSATHLVGILAANSSRATQPLQWND